MDKLTHIDLFSGIGGFSLAARWNGIQTVQFVEIDPFCQKVLKKNFPGVPIHNDIKTFKRGDRWQESVQNVKKEKLREKENHIANHAIQRELPFGGLQILRSEEPETGKGKKQVGIESLTTTGENVFVVENQQGNFSQSTTRTIMGTQSVEITSHKLGKLSLSEDSQMTTRSFAITATTPRPTMENAPTERIRNESIFLLTAGTPCQPASCAGKRKGRADDRWLWEETLRVIAEVKPRWCILENVRGLLSLEQGMAFEHIVSEVEAIGYETQAFVIPACAVNAPHRRDRVWIVANSANLNEQRGIGTGNHSWRSEVPFGNENCHTADSGCFIQTEQEQQAAGSKQYHCHASHSSSQRLQGGQWPPAHGEGQAAHGSVTQRNSAWDESWIDVAFRTCLRTLDDGLSGGLVRPKGWRVNALKAAGNSIVPQVAYQIIKSILEVEKSL